MSKILKINFEILYHKNTQVNKVQTNHILAKILYQKNILIKSLKCQKIVWEKNGLKEFIGKKMESIDQKIPILVKKSIQRIVITKTIENITTFFIKICN